MSHAQCSVVNVTKLFGMVNVIILTIPICEIISNTRSFFSPRTKNDHGAGDGNDVAAASPNAATATTSLLDVLGIGISFVAIVVVVIVVVVVDGIVRRYSDLS